MLYFIVPLSVGVCFSASPCWCRSHEHTRRSPQSLCDKLIQQINDIGKLEGRERDRKLRDLLHKSFPVIRFKTLRPIVMAILKHTREVDHKFLKVLVSSRCLRGLDSDSQIYLPTVESVLVGTSWWRGTSWRRARCWERMHGCAIFCSKVCYIIQKGSRLLFSSRCSYKPDRRCR